MQLMSGNIKQKIMIYMHHYNYNDEMLQNRETFLTKKKEEAQISKSRNAIATIQSMFILDYLIKKFECYILFFPLLV